MCREGRRRCSSSSYKYRIRRRPGLRILFMRRDMRVDNNNDNNNNNNNNNDKKNNNNNK